MLLAERRRPVPVALLNILCGFDERRHDALRRVHEFRRVRQVFFVFFFNVCLIRQ